MTNDYSQASSKHKHITTAIKKKKNYEAESIKGAYDGLYGWCAAEIRQSLEIILFSFDTL